MRRDGFTLIELLVVVGIVGILAAIAVPRYEDSRERAYVATMQSDLAQLRIVQEEFRVRAGEDSYAEDVGDLGDGFRVSTGVTVTITGAGPDFWSAEASHPGTDRICSYSTTTAAIVCGMAGAGDPKDDGGDAK